MFSDIITEKLIMIFKFFVKFTFKLWITWSIICLENLAANLWNSYHLWPLQWMCKFIFLSNRNLSTRRFPFFRLHSHLIKRYIVVMMCFERFLAVVFPTRSMEFRTKYNFGYFLNALWMTTFISSMLVFYYQEFKVSSILTTILYNC